MKAYRLSLASLGFFAGVGLDLDHASFSSLLSLAATYHLTLSGTCLSF